MLPNLNLLTEKAIRSSRIIEAAVDGMHLQRELNLIEDLLMNDLDDTQKSYLLQKKAKLAFTLKNCDTYLKEALTDPLMQEMNMIGSG